MSKLTSNYYKDLGTDLHYKYVTLTDANILSAKESSSDKKINVFNKKA